MFSIAPIDFVLPVVLGIIPAYIAKNKGRSFGIWYLVCLWSFVIHYCTGTFYMSQRWCKVLFKAPKIDPVKPWYC